MEDQSATLLWWSPQIPNMLYHPTRSTIPVGSDTRTSLKTSDARGRQFLYSRDIESVLVLKDAVGKRFRRVSLEHRNFFLQDDLAVVEQFVNDVNGASGCSHAGLDSLPLSVKPRESRK